MGPRLVRSLAVALGCAILAVGASPHESRALTDSPVWRRPVDGPVVAPFRAPANDYAPGHRGADLAVPAGTPVHAAGAGVVAFAGDVAGTLHVVVAHAGDLRTSYSFLSAVAVRAGDAVERGAVLGLTGGTGEGHDGSALHFGLRVGDRYVDPMQLFRPDDLTKLVHLVPTGAPHEEPWTVDREATALRRSLRLPAPVAAGTTEATGSAGGCGDGIPLVGGFISDACTVAGWLGGRAGDALDAGLDFVDTVTGVGDAIVDRLHRVLHATLALLEQVPDALARALARTPPGQLVADLVEIGRRFYDTVTMPCDDDAPAADGRGGSGHRVMVVAGIDSSGAAGSAPTVGLDVEALGYLPRQGEVRYFSYAADGGRYTAADTHGDLSVDALHLRDQLRAMQREEPGREVDLVGHSLGGVVIDVFLSKYYDPTDALLPPLGNVITLSSPHEGAPLATTAAELREHAVARVVLDDVLAGPASAIPPPDSAAVRELAETSTAIRGLFPHGVPEHVDFTTIGAVHDVVVPATNISVHGATETAVGGALLGAHGAIVRDPEALRAVRAALEGRAPPCVSLGTALQGAIEPVLISRVEHNAAGVVYFRP